MFEIPVEELILSLDDRRQAISILRNVGRQAVEFADKLSAATSVQKSLQKSPIRYSLSPDPTNVLLTPSDLLIEEVMLGTTNERLRTVVSELGRRLGLDMSFRRYY